MKGVSHPVVPLLGNTSSHGKQPRGFDGFAEFLETQGWHKEDVRLVDGNERHVLGVIQSWLFFGLLVEAFGGRVMQRASDPSAFIREREAGGSIINTETLPKYFWYWLTRRFHDDREEAVQHAREVDRCMALGRAVFDNIATQAGELDMAKLSGDFWSIRNVVLLSMATMAECISKARQVAINYQESLVDSATNLSWRFHSVRSAMRGSVRCPAEIGYLMRENNTTCLYYLSLMDRRYLGRDHGRCMERASCQAVQIDYDTYQSAHVYEWHDQSTCEMIGPEVKDVADVLSRDKLPLVMDSTHFDGQASTCSLLEHDKDGVNGPGGMSQSPMYGPMY